MYLPLYECQSHKTETSNRRENIVHAREGAESPTRPLSPSGTPPFPNLSCFFMGQTFGEGVHGLVSGGGVVCEDNLSGAFNLLREEMMTYFDVFRAIDHRNPGSGRWR